MGSRIDFKWRLMPWLAVGLLASFTLGATVLSIRQAPRYWGIPASGSSRAKAELRRAIKDTEASASFTVSQTTGSNQLGPTVYQAPNMTLNTLSTLETETVGPYSYIHSDACPGQKWYRYRTAFHYGPGNVFLDLDYLWNSQRVERVGNQFYAEWVPSFPFIKVIITATVRNNRIAREVERFRYARRIDWLIRPVKPRNYGYTLSYSRFNSSPRFSAPPPNEVVVTKPGRLSTISQCPS